MSPITSPNPADAKRYEAILGEAQRIKGVSLGKDAWRRLRRNRVAMLALGFLILLALVAFFTPMLPLQSPIEIDLEHRQFLSPNMQPVRIDLELSQSTLEEIEDLREESHSAPPDRLNKIEAEITSLENSRIDAQFNNPNWFVRWMIQARMYLFGDWCIPSLCGTDMLGRDLLARLCWGARVSLIVGIVATLVSLVIGVSYGAISGYVGGWLDNAMMRLVDVLYSIPFIFVVIFAITFLSADDIKAALDDKGISQIVIFYILIGAIYWLTMARVVRGQVISLKHEQFVEAARTIGAGPGRIIFRHMVPNVLSIVIVYLTLTIPAVMLFEAFLSFLGLGVAPPDVSWGLLANEGLQVITPVRIYWWVILFPGLALALTLFALNFLGDGLRDALDPRLKNR